MPSVIFDKQRLLYAEDKKLELSQNFGDLNALYCDLRGQIKENAQSLYHVMSLGHVSMQYQHTHAICIVYCTLVIIYYN